MSFCSFISIRISRECIPTRKVLIGGELCEINICIVHLALETLTLAKKTYVNFTQIIFFYKRECL